MLKIEQNGQKISTKQPKNNKKLRKNTKNRGKVTKNYSNNEEKKNIKKIPQKILRKLTENR